MKCYAAGTLPARQESERFPVDDLLKRDKLNLDIFWLKDDNLDDVDSLPSPDVLALEIVENLGSLSGRRRRNLPIPEG